MQGALATGVFLAATAGAFITLARRLVPQRVPAAQWATPMRHR